jgi:hypothetical protein
MLRHYNKPRISVDLAGNPVSPENSFSSYDPFSPENSFSTDNHFSQEIIKNSQGQVINGCYRNGKFVMAIEQGGSKKNKRRNKINKNKNVKYQNKRRQTHKKRNSRKTRIFRKTRNNRKQI